MKTIIYELMKTLRRFVLIVMIRYPILNQASQYFYEAAVRKQWSNLFGTTDIQIFITKIIKSNLFYNIRVFGFE